MIFLVLLLAALIAVAYSLIGDLTGERRIGYASLTGYSLFLLILDVLIVMGYPLTPKSLSSIVISNPDILLVLFLLIIGLIGAVVGLCLYYRRSPHDQLFITYTVLFIVIPSIIIFIRGLFYFIALWEALSFTIFYYTMRIGGALPYTYIIPVHLADLLIISGAMILYGEGYRVIGSSNPGSIGLILLLSGLVAKSGSFPYHFWVQPVYEKLDPMRVAVISGVIDNVAIYEAARFIMPIGYDALIQAILISLGIIDIVIASIWYWGTKKIESILAYSTIYNTGWLLLIVGILVGRPSKQLIWIISLYLLSYAPGKAGLFLLIRKGVETSKIRLLDPLLGFGYAIGILAVEGIPPFNLFIARLNILSIVFAKIPVALLLLLPAWFLSSLFFYKLFREVIMPAGKGMGFIRDGGGVEDSPVRVGVSFILYLICLLAYPIIIYLNTCLGGG